MRDKGLIFNAASDLYETWHDYYRTQHNKKIGNNG
jgi:hypothetical protein